jgi:CRP-like cAMP-binding protein
MLMASHQDNQLLARLGARGLSELARYLKPVELHRGATLAEPHKKIRNVYFPVSGVISFVAHAGRAGGIHTAVVGKDGVIGATQALDDKISLNGIYVQVAGAAFVIDRDPLREAIRNNNAIRRVLAAHEEFFNSDVQQTAACNAVHQVDERTARWLLRMSDLVGGDIPLTQNDLAEMIGVSRPSVSIEASRLQTAGAIEYTRGQIHIKDVQVLKRFACECHGIVSQNYKSVFDAASEE